MVINCQSLLSLKLLKIILIIIYKRKKHEYLSKLIRFIISYF